MKADAALDLSKTPLQNHSRTAAKTPTVPPLCLAFYLHSHDFSVCISNMFFLFTKLILMSLIITNSEREVEGGEEKVREKEKVYIKSWRSI